MIFILYIHLFANLEPYNDIPYTESFQKHLKIKKGMNMAYILFLLLITSSLTL